MTESIGRPAYQQVAEDLRQRIASGEFPVGSAIPSTSKLASAHAVSITVVRAAVTQLRADGLLIGQPGKGVFVRSTPEAIAERTATVDDLAKQVGELRAELHRVEALRRDEVAGELAELRETVGLIRRRLVDLYGQLGKPYPDDGLAALPGVERAVDWPAGERPPASS